MPFSLSRLRPAAVVLLAVAFAACSDDDGTNPPATPPAPTGLAAVRSTDGLSIEVTWTAVTGATSYVLQRAVGSPAGTFEEVANDLTSPQYTDTDITADQAYSYQVAATNAEGTGSFSSTVTVEPGTAGEAVDTLTGSITSSITLSADTLYVLSGYVKVASGATSPSSRAPRSSATPRSRAARSGFCEGPRSTPRAPRRRPSSSPRASPRAPARRATGAGSMIIGNGIINRSGDSADRRAAGRHRGVFGRHRQRRQQRHAALRADRVRRVRRLRRRGAGAQQPLHVRRGLRDHAGVRADARRPGRLVRVVGRRRGRPLPGLLRVRRRPLRLDRGVPRAEPVPDRVPVRPAGSGRGRRPALHRPGGLRGRRLQRRWVAMHGFASRAVLDAGVRQLHPDRPRHGDRHARRGRRRRHGAAPRHRRLSRPTASSRGGRARASRSATPRPTTC